MRSVQSKQKEKLLSAGDNAIFCDQVAMLLQAGISLHDGMGTLRSTYKGTRYGERFEQLDRSVREYGSLASAVEEAGMFPVYMINMIRIGERAGILQDVMEALAEHYQREDQVRHTIRNAVTYPLVLVLMMAVVIGILSINVLPIFMQVYDTIGAETSSSAAAVMRFGVTAGSIVIVLVAFLLIVVLVMYILLHTRKRDQVMSWLQRIFPSVRHINEKLSAARFSSVLAKLLEGGFPMEEAMSLVVDIIPDKSLAKKIEISKENIGNGMNFADAVEKTGIFSDIHSRMLKIAGMSGKIDTTLSKLGQLYDEEADDGIRKLVSIIEPSMVGILCMIIGAILLSVMLPLASVLSAIA